MSSTEGKAAAVADGVKAMSARAQAAAEDPEQLAFLTPIAPSRFEGEAEVRQRRKIENWRGGRGGRPPGAPNKATANMRKFYARFAFRIMQDDFNLLESSPDALATELCCTILQAAEFLAGRRDELRRYFFAPMAQVAEDGRPVPQMSMNVTVDGRTVVLGPGMMPWALDPEVAAALAKEAAKRPLLEVEAAKSQTDKSQGTDK